MREPHKLSMDIATLLTSMVDKKDLRVVHGSARILEALDAFGRDELDARERMQLNAAAANVRRTILEAQEAASANDRLPLSRERGMVEYINSYVDAAGTDAEREYAPGGLTA
jgi:hypothetical protein